MAKKKFMSDDGNGIIALAQDNNEAFHSQEMAMRMQ